MKTICIDLEWASLDLYSTRRKDNVRYHLVGFGRHYSICCKITELNSAAFEMSERRRDMEQRMHFSKVREQDA